MSMWIIHCTSSSYTCFCFSRFQRLRPFLYFASQEGSCILCFWPMGCFFCSYLFAYGVVFWFFLFVSLYCGPLIHFHCIIHCDQWNLFPFTKRKRKKSTYTWAVLSGLLWVLCTVFFYILVIKSLYVPMWSPRHLYAQICPIKHV